MTKPELVNKVAEQGQISRAQAEAAIDALGAKVAECLKADGEINVPGLGRFKVKESPARKGRNPRTGETIQIAAKRKVVFSAAKAVRDAVA